MTATIALRREDLNKTGELRAAISPKTARALKEQGIPLWVQPASHPNTGEKKRAFGDEAYQAAGAELKELLTQARVIVGLKEVAIDALIPERTYLFFSHTHKGQTKNRSLLNAMMDKGLTLIDYELITDARGRRILTAFTTYAGYAGMVDTLWTLGERLKLEGLVHPISALPQSQHCGGMAGARERLKAIGKVIAARGTPPELPPLITAFLGRGRTSHGAQRLYDLLAPETITLAQLPEIHARGDRHTVYKLELEVFQMYRHRPGVRVAGYEGFTEAEKLHHYLDHPELYQSNLDQVLPYVTVLMNCILWSDHYPRVLPSALMQEVWSEARTLKAIGDISCDPNGGIEFSKETWVDNPVFIHDPARGQITNGFEGDGVAVMAVTNLPCEFPEDASSLFADELAPYLSAIAEARYDGSLAEAGLPPEIARAVILWRGALVPGRRYMGDFIV